MTGVPAGVDTLAGLAVMSATGGIISIFTGDEVTDAKFASPLYTAVTLYTCPRFDVLAPAARFAVLKVADPLASKATGPCAGSASVDPLSNDTLPVGDPTVEVTDAASVAVVPRPT